MYNFKEFLRKLNEHSGVSFKLVSEDGTVWFDSTINIDRQNLIKKEIWLGNQTANLLLNKDFEICASLLKYSIESKYNEIFSIREQVIIDMLEGRGVSTEALYSALPFLHNKCTLFLIAVDKNIYDSLNIIKQLYNSEEVISMIYKEYIVVLGNFEDEMEHAISMREAILSDLYTKCYVSYSSFEGGAVELKKSFDDSLTCIFIGKKYDLKNLIFDEESLLLEKIVYNVNDHVKHEVCEKFKDKFIKFDSEIITTIEEFINNGLNISEAAKKLYIHRNTLIYRLDKILKDTGYDIRDFKQASIFIIAFLMWKERRI
ncbi:transcriptional regulator [Clostridium polyendosporum]|uniref:Transcriptional regulator n=1 Tax=Clostridium polyendosporum TaxID=69208 RepID=A0A919VG21_9CLOT|nr:helix-turn-helix domain-containing protein [Clostridium polyendosporum]GIM28995.1 transcriptional regulator [Clostridium polyendosporum]